MLARKKEMEVKGLDLRLKCPFKMIVTGPSNCGKRTFTKKLLTIRRLKYNQTPGKVYQDSYNHMLELGIVDEFIEGLVSMDWIKENILMGNCTLDMALDANEDTDKIFTIGSHHYDVNMIFTCQNIFTNSKYFSDITLNATYQALFKNPRDKSTIVNFGKQFAPGRSRDLATLYSDRLQQSHTAICSWITIRRQEKEIEFRLTYCLKIMILFQSTA